MPPLLFSLLPSPCSGLPLRRLLLFRCSASSATRSSSLAPYHASFARRMALAGIHPYHRIALVSGGPGSMALCALAKPLASAHPHLNRLYGSIYKPPRRLFSTEYMNQHKVSGNLRTGPKELIQYINPVVPDIGPARIERNSTHRDGAIYNNTRLQEEFLEGDLADRNETRLEPMMKSKPTGMCIFPEHMFQFFSVLLSKSPISNGSIQLYGYIAARDEWDGMLNYIVNYSRDNPIVVQEGSLIEMTGPKRGIQMRSIVVIEFDMKIKSGIQEEKDLQLIDGAIVCSGVCYEPWKPIKHRIIGSSGAVDVTSVVLALAVEATIEVVVSEVQSGLGLSLSSFLDVIEGYEEVQLFDGIIAESGPLRRFVVAVLTDTMMFLKVKVGNVVKSSRYGSTSRHQV